ncbi:J domain-containing protein [Pseudorhodoferax sp.]|uniref:J domain-containing protein n=1 Tax=Pseudorhodoferax sp. TaxID=1993553 RepID=UPI002DD64B35|nr:J domain-containing protein [Pseudorhodoferax sp.]
MTDLTTTADRGQPPQLLEFHRLTDAIAAQRALLQRWQQASQDFHQQQAAALAPLLASQRAIDLDLLRFLDQAAHAGDLGRTDLRILHALVRDLAASLLREGDTPELRAIHARHQDADDADPPGDDEADAPPAGAAAPPPADDDSDWMAQWERMEAAQSDAARQRERQRDQHKAASRRQRMTAAPQPEDASQTIRTVYRKLASALHPDREPDATQRARKTALMQRVNVAYGARNLLDLLQLQLEIEQIDTHSIAAMGDAALRRYNAVLAEQLDELRQETTDTERGFRTQLGLGHGAEPTATRITRAIREQVRALQQNIAYYQWERAELEDPRFFKQWLREQRA